MTDNGLQTENDVLRFENDVLRAALNGADSHPSQVHGHLTARQIECLTWVGQGKSDHEIGIILGISGSTVHKHIEFAKTRLSVPTRCQAVVVAFQFGLISL